MKITAIKQQQRDPDRVNVSIDGKYRFSLDISQVVDLGVKVGLELDEIKLKLLEKEGQFSKIYCRARDYCLMRPHSTLELRQYLKRKSLPRKSANGRAIPGFSVDLISRVIERLQTKKYLDDDKFTKFWIENRCTKKGISRAKLVSELLAKGIARDVVDANLATAKRDDLSEIRKVIAKKAKRYADKRQLMAYLSAQGFRYDDIKQAMSDSGE